VTGFVLPAIRRFFVGRAKMRELTVNEIEYVGGATTPPLPSPLYGPSPQQQFLELREWLARQAQRQEP